jgi:protein-disulfide isomerase-like protein with CxxC motif
MSTSAALAVESAPLAQEAPDRVRLVWYTDPINVWCWGCDPGIRRLQVRYPAAVQVDVVMGGLFEDFGPIRESWARMSGGRWQDSVQAFLNAVAAHHRMPMDVPKMISAIDDLNSTWPSCIAVKAAGLQGPGRALAYLRRFREAMYIEGRAPTRREVQFELAFELGLDAASFARSLGDGTAEAAFHRDLDLCRVRNVTGFPTFELRRAEATVRMDGWQPWEAFEEAVKEVAPGLEPLRIPVTTESVRSLLRRYARCATLEIAAILGVTDDEAELLLEDLEAQGAVTRREVGTGLFWALSRQDGPRRSEQRVDRIPSP